MAGRERAHQGGAVSIGLIVLVLFVCVLAVAATVAVMAVRRLPDTLAWLVGRFAPALQLEMTSAELHGDGLDARGVKLALRGSPGPILAADEIELGFSLGDLLNRRLGSLRLKRPVITVPEQLPWAATGGATGAGPAGIDASLGRLVIEDGRFEMPPGSGRPGVGFSFSTDSSDVGLSAADAGRPRQVRLWDVAVTPPGDVAAEPIFSAQEILLGFSIAELERARLAMVRVRDPVLTVPLDAAWLSDGSLAAGNLAAEPEATSTGVEVGKLVAENGIIRVPAHAGRPGVDLDFALDLEEVGTSSALADRRHVVPVRDLRVMLPGREHVPSLVLDEASAEFTTGGMLEQSTIEALRVQRGTAVLDRAMRDFLTAQQGGSETGGGAADQWMVRQLDISQLGVRLAELGTKIPDITFSLHTTLTDVPLGAEALAKAETPQRIELSRVALYSPFNPFEEVIGINSVFVEFSLAGVLRQEIAEIALIRPTIHLGEDLFWYMTAERSDDSGGSMPWKVATLRAELGSVIVELEQLDRIGLPLTFHTEAHNVSLEKLADLRIAAELEVPRETYRFPGLGIEMIDVHGKLQFDYPPGPSRQNLVSVLYTDEIRWNDYRLDEGWLSLTFQADGVSGEYGAKGYSGYVNGGITVPYGSEKPTNGWLSGTDLDLAAITQIAGKGSVDMTGKLGAQLSLTVEGQSLASADGKLALAEPGRLSITGLDKVLDQLPAGLEAWKRDLVRIAIEALRDFDYRRGDGNLHYADGAGTVRVALEGERTSRRFEVNYKSDEAGEPRLAARGG